MTFEEVRLQDSTVHDLMAQNAGPEAIIIALAEQKQALLKKVIELDSIAPKRFKLKDGKVLIWHCPDHLVPETSL